MKFTGAYFCAAARIAKVHLDFDEEAILQMDGGGQAEDARARAAPDRQQPDPDQLDQGVRAAAEQERQTVLRPVPADPQEEQGDGGRTRRGQRDPQDGKAQRDGAGRATGADEQRQEARPGTGEHRQAAHGAVSDHESVVRDLTFFSGFVSCYLIKFWK